MIKHSLFPTLVLEDYYENNEEFLSNFISSFRNTVNLDYMSKIFVHKEDLYSDLYKYLNLCIKKYLESAGVDVNLFDIYFTKSWINATDKQSVPVHSHADIHLAVVYYVNIPEDQEQAIVFHYNEQDREPSSGLYALNSINYTEFNSGFYSIRPYQGQVLVFPGRLLHHTEHINDSINSFASNQLIRKRISIASDVVLVYKEKNHGPLGLQPISDWRKFDE